MKHILLYISERYKSVKIFFNKINFGTYIKINNDEKFEYIKRLFYDSFQDDSINRIEHVMYGLDEFIRYFHRTNERLHQNWC